MLLKCDEKKLFISAYTIFASCGVSNVTAQHRLIDVPKITLEDFQGQVPENSTFPIYINSRVYYRIDTAISKGVDRFKVGVKTQVGF